jgi:hypothetical protein
MRPLKRLVAARAFVSALQREHLSIKSAACRDRRALCIPTFWFADVPSTVCPAATTFPPFGMDGPKEAVVETVHGPQQQFPGNQLVK